jgi:sugar lactone lactonase YvrE
MWWLFLACRPSSPVSAAPSASQSVLVVSSYFGDQIDLFDPASGQPVGKIRGLDGPQTVVAGPDGEWIACSELQDAVVRIDPRTGEVVGTLVADDPVTPADETGGLVHPDAAVFGPDGRLYVASFETDQVLVYTADGVFAGVAVEAGAGGLDGPDIGLGFDPGGSLVVPGWTSHHVHRFTLAGEPLPDLVGPGHGLEAPRDVVFDARGHAYVSGFESDGVLRVDAVTGAITPFAALAGAAGLALDEQAGVLFAASGADDTVHALALDTGEDLGIRVDAPRIDGITSVRLFSLTP